MDKGIIFLIDFASICGLILITIGFLTRVTPQLKRRVLKKFALFPVCLSNGSWVWLRWYLKYQTYGHGVVLGGSVKAHIEGKKISYSSKRGSFFPSYKTELTCLNKFEIRSILKSSNWSSKLYQKRNQQFLENILKQKST